MVIIYLFIIYFLPTLIAWVRKHDNLEAVFQFNATLGWTVIFWFAALYSAFDDHAFDDNN